MKLLVATLVVLLPTLALLQYRWVGQVSQAERERMQTHLRNAALQFHEALDGEVARAIANLQISAATAREGTSDRYADRFEAWAATAAHPEAVSDVFLIDEATDALRMRRWNPETRTLEEAAWTPALTAIRPGLEADYRQFRRGAAFGRQALALSTETVALVPLRPLPADLVVGIQPPPAPTWGFTAVQFDEVYFRQALLPELAQRYFALDDNRGYRVSVLSSADPSIVIFRSDPDAPTSAAGADAIEPLLSARAFFVRGGGRGDGPRPLAVSPPAGETPSDRRPEDVQPGFVAPPDRGRWTLLARHQLGSLEEAVGATRRRNLGISFGTLLLLSGTVLMLAWSSRRAQRLAMQQMEFVAGVSHELRTPIAVIRSASENLAQGVVTSPERVRRYGETMGAEARRLGDMVERVLQYAGIEAGRVISSTTPLEPSVVIDEAVQTSQPLVRAAGATLEQDVPTGLPLVMGDLTALRSAVQNLITNAIKYGGADKWLAVRATRGRGTRGEEIQITVEDHGPGISATELRHLFEPFFRGADAAAAQIQGNGLGLSIVKKVVEAHGGRVTVSTRVGVGTAFTLHLPASPPNAQPSAAGLETRRAAAHS